MPVRDAVLQPMIDPPRRVDPADIRRRFPGAVEALAERNDRGRLTINNDGRLWFERDSAEGPSAVGLIPSGPCFVWRGEQGWVFQHEHAPTMCNCGKPLKERGRCSGCGRWPSVCFCPRVA